MPIFNSADLTLARQRVRDYSWSAQILKAVRARADEWLAHPANAPTLAGGWMHDYACPAHWCALAFDPASPHAHRCPVGGETREGEKLDAAWRVLEHFRIANAMRDLALVYALTEERAYAEEARNLLSQYARAYSTYAGAESAPTWMLKGRAFQQALTEAIWAVRIAQTYDLVHATLVEQDTRIINALLRPMVGTLITAQDELVQQQKKLKSNYNAWLIAALGLLGYALRDPVLVERAIDSPIGFRAHLAAAILPDGFEYEATPYYHNFVALAYTILAEAAHANGRDLYAERGPDGQSIEKMWHAFAALAFADGTIPQIGDGAYWSGSTFASEICETYEVALACTEDAEYAWLLDRTYAGAQRPRDTWTALLFAERDITAAPTPARTSICLSASGLALLRDDTHTQQICVPFGASAGTHSHFDRAAVQISPWSIDPGNSPYGIPVCADWYRQTAAHNTLVVDGQSQAQCQPHLLNWESTPHSTALWLSMDDAYPGVRLTRSISLSDGLIKDSTLIDSGEEHTYDWIMHLDEECRIEDLILEYIMGEFAETGAYRYITPFARRHCSGKFVVMAQTATATIRLTVTADAPLEIILARAPARATAPLAQRQMLIARARQHRVNFVATSQMLIG
jgi:hypothetical protein